jgi:hypothetical protein
MKRFVAITGLVALTMGALACSSSEEGIVRESRETTYSSVVTPTPPPATVQEKTVIEKRTSTVTTD